MWSILKGLLGLGNTITGIAGKIADAKVQMANAANDRERIAAEERIKAYEQQAAAMIAASTNDKWWSTRELIGKCVLLYVAKIVVWDTVLKLGVTPDPGEQVWWIVATVIGFYFVSKSAEKITNAIASRWGARA